MKTMLKDLSKSVMTPRFRENNVTEPMLTIHIQIYIFGRQIIASNQMNGFSRIIASLFMILSNSVLECMFKYGQQNSSNCAGDTVTRCRHTPCSVASLNCTSWHMFAGLPKYSKAFKKFSGRHWGRGEGGISIFEASLTRIPYCDLYHIFPFSFFR